MTTMPLRDHAAYRRETLRWCGQRAARARTLDVFDPYSGLRVGTVPLATVDDVRRAFDYAVAYPPAPSRDARAQLHPPAAPPRPAPAAASGAAASARRSKACCAVRSAASAAGTAPPRGLGNASRTGTVAM